MTITELPTAHRLSVPVASGENYLLTSKEAALFSVRHPVTIRVALADRSLHGIQRKAGGHWLIEKACLIAWMTGEKCAHVTPPAPLDLVRLATKKKAA